jgi:hypothetical protein
MQMLHRAGVNCAGKWPSFESPEALSQLADGPYSAMQLDGTTIKYIAGGPWKMPSPGPLYRAVWISRNRYEQAKSQIKFLKMAAGHDVAPNRRMHREAVERLVRSNAVITKQAIDELQRLTLHHVSFVCFEDLLRRPEIATIPLIGMYQAPLEAQREARALMATVIRKRPASCQKGLRLEAALLREMPPPFLEREH